MLTEEQKEQLLQRLLSDETRIQRNAQSSLILSMEPADTGRDSLDQSTSEEMLSTDLRLRDREKKLSKKISEAVRRVEEGTIDECEECGESIGFKRLMARPVTTLCIHCKESREEQEQREVAIDRREAPSEGLDDNAAEE